jgi:hypothetical protein
MSIAGSGDDSSSTEVALCAGVQRHEARGPGHRKRYPGPGTVMKVVPGREAAPGVH